MKIYCENCMGENEIEESHIQENGYRAFCENCGHMIFVDSDAVDAILLRKKGKASNQTGAAAPILDQDQIIVEDPDEITQTRGLSSVAQSNTTTTIAARLDLPKQTKTSEAVLTVMDGPDLGLEFTMDSSKIILGRRGADINLNDRLVSRRHASVEAAGGRYLLKDLGSTNSSFLNGSPVSMEFLKHGDEIQIGSTLIRFRIKNMESDIVVIDR